MTVDNKYSDFLPSGHNIAMDVTRDFVVRLAAAKVMSRPPLGSVSPGGSISTTGTLVDLDRQPVVETVPSQDLDASFGVASAETVSLGLFQKNISTYIQSLRVNVQAVQPDRLAAFAVTGQLHR